MANSWTGTYVGSVEELRGKTAIVVRETTQPGRCRAQFDDMDLIHPADGSQLGYNWHSFDADDFEWKPSPFNEESS